ncbi:hypothetical protein GOP47_0029872 [Adiantum capillus-veneris]|nr:hypothetical protein GOP47_0029872 [Adiantum capillus-veneris]
MRFSSSFPCSRCGQGSGEAGPSFSRFPQISKSPSRKGRGLPVPCKNVANKAKGKSKKNGICSLVYVMDIREPGIVNVCLFPFL